MDQPGTGTTLPGAAWRHRWFVAAMTLLGALVGLVVSARGGTAYQATASLVVSNTETTTSAEGGAIIDTNPERYVADQVAILKLPTVSDLAAKTANEALGRKKDKTLPTDLTGDDVRAMQSVSNVTGTNLIEISATSDRPVVARVVADALASSYQSVRSSQNQTASSLEALEAALTANQTDLADVERQITDLRAVEGGTSLNVQYRRLLEQIGTTGPTEGVDATVAAIDSLQRIERQMPSFAPLYARRDGLLQQGISIQGQIDATSGEGQKVKSNIAVFSPAQAPVQVASLGSTTLVGLGAVFLGGVAVALAYWRDSRRREFSNAFEPASVLAAPLIAEIPDFYAERLTGLLPMIGAPESVAAEAFRFAVASLRVSVGKGVIGVVSPTVGDGKTVATANLALAQAQAHTSVLAIDADLKAQGLVQLFAPVGVESVPGITEVIDAGLTTYAPVKLDLGDDRIDLLPGGSADREPSRLFGSSASAALFERFRADYEVTVIDVAPLLNVAYGTAVLKDVDAAVVVIRHGSPIANAEQLAAKLHLFGVPVAGYIYTMAPLAEDRTRMSTAPAPLGQRRIMPNLFRGGSADAAETPVSVTT